MKKPLTPCQLCQQALAGCREVVSACHDERDRLRQELEQERARNTTLQQLLEESKQALELGARELRQAASRTERNLVGDVQLWLIKDFNVLYRCAQRLLDTLAVEYAAEPRDDAAHALRAQLERLKPAFTDTEEVRALMRERQARR